MLRWIHTSVVDVDVDVVVFELCCILAVGALLNSKCGAIFALVASDVASNYSKEVLQRTRVSRCQTTEYHGPQ